MRPFTPPPAAVNPFDAYVSDPANPVPYRRRPILPTYARGSTWSRWLADDQRFASAYRSALASLYQRGARATLESLV